MLIAPDEMVPVGYYGICDEQDLTALRRIANNAISRAVGCDSGCMSEMYGVMFPIMMFVRSHLRNEVVNFNGSENPIEILMEGVGACSRHTLCTRALLRSMGLRSRAIELSNEDGTKGHIVAEVRLCSGKWALIDPLNVCAFMRNGQFMSALDARLHPECVESGVNKASWNDDSGAYSALFRNLNVHEWVLDEGGGGRDHIFSLQQMSLEDFDSVLYGGSAFIKKEG